MVVELTCIRDFESIHEVCVCEGISFLQGEDDLLACLISEDLVECRPVYWQDLSGQLAPCSHLAVLDENRCQTIINVCQLHHWMGLMLTIDVNG